jgi:thymidylate kinase
MDTEAGAAPSTVHPLLADAFAALDGAGVEWCLLRGEAAVTSGAAPSGDVDLLVAPHHLAAAEGALAPLAIVPLERWGAGVHRLLFGYHAPTDAWVEFDVEPELDYGPQASFLVNWLLPVLRSGGAAACLARRQRRDGIWVLHPDDAFWTLLLHCIVDRGGVADRHRARLRALAAEADAAGWFGSLVTRACPPGWDAARVIAAAAAGDWDSLAGIGRQLPARATARHPVSIRLRALARGAGRLAATAWRMRRGRGFSVALLGPDGSGKSTLSAGLVEHCGVPARRVYMGLWQGEEGQSRGLVQAALAAAGRPVKVWRRYLEARYHTARGRLVVFDRHVYDALVPPEPPLVWAKRLFFGLLAHAAPGPDLVLVLDLPAEATTERRPGEDPERLRSLRSQYLALAERLPHAEVLQADQTKEALRAEAMERIWQAWARRSRHGCRCRSAGGGPSGPVPTPAAG